MAQTLRNEEWPRAGDEQLVLVDADGREIGQLGKEACHDGSGVLHRAFSLFIFDPLGRVLLQQRSRYKRLWPGYWANSCCSHPRAGEPLAQACRRRLDEELGMRCALQFVFEFEYQARYGDIGAEHELCSVYIGTSSAPVSADPQEIAAWRFVLPAELDAEMAHHPHSFTPWLRIEWQRLRGEFDERLPAAARRHDARSVS